MSHGIWDLPGPGIEHVSSCIDRQILCHSVTREARIIKDFISIPMKVLSNSPFNFFFDTLVIEVYVIYLPYGCEFSKLSSVIDGLFYSIPLKNVYFAFVGWSCSIDD